MKELRFDFTKDARRSSIADQLRYALGEAGWQAATSEAMQAGIPMHHHHGIVEIRQTIANLKTSQVVKEDLGAVYEILAAAEAQVHGCAVDETHFHEVGEGTALFNTLVTCCAFEHLNPGRVVATPVQTGSGKVECAHGLMDIPAPATAAILTTGVPVCQEKLDGELCTPTSAAIIKHFVTEFEE